MTTLLADPAPASPAALPPAKSAPPLRMLGGWQIVELSLWLGLLLGTWDVAVAAVRKLAWGEFLFANHHIFWMTTVTHLGMFLAIGSLLAVAASRGGSLAAVRWVAFVLSFIAAWSLLVPLPGLLPVAEILLAVGIATQASRLAEKHSAGLLKCARRSWPLLAAGHGLVAAVVIASGIMAERRALASLPPAPVDAPNVLLVVLDTVCYDALDLGAPSDLGLPQAHTPRLAEFAAEGVNFRRAISTSSWTLPAHASMFSGRQVHQHQATWHRGPNHRSDTLAERLQQAGYLTGGFVGNNIYCSRETGLARGFVHYEDYPLDLTRFLQSTSLGRQLLELVRWNRVDRVERKRADDVTEPFFTWLDKHEAGEPEGAPFFAFLNYFDAHDPYVAPPDYAEHVPATSDDRVAIRDWWHIDKLSLSDQQVALGMYGYLDCIEYLDHHFGELLGRLERCGLLENTLVIVTSDHGEHFGDHGLFGHGNSLYQPLVHVPLLVRWPGHVPPGERVDEFVSLADLPATVLQLAGHSQQEIPGRPWSRFWNGEASSEPVFTELPGPSAFPPNHGASPIFNGPMRAVIVDGFKYIRAGDVEELYDLRNDPAEEQNLVDLPEHRERVEELRNLAGEAAL